jgi:hypothetical protein
MPEEYQQMTKPIFPHNEQPAGDKPLFVPLKAEFYEAFERGIKTTEYRLHGPRWNARTCYPGRVAVLSYGYGKQRRMRCTIKRFTAQTGHNIRKQDQDSVVALYGNLDAQLACIEFEGFEVSK